MDTDRILDYYLSRADSEDVDQNYIDKFKDHFAFNTSEIPLSRYEEFFQEYQKTWGKARNVLESFNEFLDVQLPNMIEALELKEENSPKITRFKNVRIYKPYMGGNSDGEDFGDDLPPKVDIVPMYPRDAMNRQDNYSSDIIVDVYSYTKESSGRYAEKTEKKDITFAKIPILKGCNKCWLYGMTDREKIAVDECFNDPLGYFIIGGMEKIVVANESVRQGQMLVSSWPIPGEKATARKKTVGKIDKAIRKSNGIRMYSIAGATSTNVQIETNSRLNDVMEVYIWNRKPFPVLNLSLTLHFIFDSSLRDTPNDNLLRTCKELLSNSIIPEILSFVPQNERSRVKSRLVPTITETIKLIDEDIKSGRSKDSFGVISRRLDLSVSDRKKMEEYPSLEEELRVNVFPSNFESENDFDRRRAMLAKMISIYARHLEGFRPEDDRNSYINKRIETVAKRMEGHINRVLKDMAKEFRTTPSIIGSDRVTNKLVSLLRSGVKTGGKRDNFSEQLQRTTPAAVYSQLHRTTITSTVEKKSKDRSTRMIHPSQFGFVCTAETPEGENCGILKNLTTLCWVSIPRDENLLEELIQDYLIESTEENAVPINLNGDLRGWMDKSRYLDLKTEVKRDLRIFDVPVRYNNMDGSIEIYTTGNIPTRPLLVVEDGIILMDAIDLDTPVEQLIQDGIIEYMSPMEIDSSWEADPVEDPMLWQERNENMIYVKIAEYVQDVGSLKEDHDNGLRTDEQPFTHAEIIPHFQFGYSGSCVPKANLNKGPRLTYQCSMFKQALAGYHSIITERYETSFKENQFPSRTVFETSTHEPIGLNAMPSTCTPVIAMYTRAMNNEDALVAKREYFDNNMRFISYTTYVIVLKSNEDIDVNPEHENNPILQALYKRSDNVDPNLIGFPKIGAYVNRHDAILGKYVRSINQSTGETILKPSHSRISLGKDGYIDGVQVLRGNKNVKIIRIRTAQYRRQVVGDKVASRYSQKGTFGQIVPEKDLPRIVNGPNDGVVPDFFFNPHSIPSRLTQGKILEILSSKAVMYTGERVDATPFGEYDNPDYMEKYEKILEENGMEKSGLETMRHPNGDLFQVQIFTGVCAYQVLKHHVADKYQVRDTGNYEPRTHQPIRGRPNEGGLKYGQQERDALISHGASSVVMDRMMESSDRYRVIVCKECGNIAVSVGYNPKNTSCMYCNSKSFGQLIIPYVSHLLVRYLNAAGIHMHFRF